MNFHHRQIFLFLILLPLLSLETASAQDLMGLYFDEAGTQTTTATTVPHQQVTAYLILKDPSFTDGLASWECSIESRSTGAEPIINWSLHGEALNVASPPFFLVGMGEPLPSESDVLLATATILLPDPGQEVAFFIHPFDPPSVSDPPGWGYPVFAPAFGHGQDGEISTAGWSSGCEATAVAVINDDGWDEPWDLHGSYPWTKEFGYVEVGEITEENISFSSIGDLPLSGTVSLTGEVFQYRHSDGYFTTDPSSFYLEPGHDLDFAIRFAPEDSVVYQEQLVLQICDRTFTVTLLGGYVEGNCVVPFSTEHDFGLIPVGGQAMYGCLVGNTGGGILTLDPSFDNDAFTAELGEGETFPHVLAPGLMIYVYVTFAPQADGDYEAVMDLGPSACSLVNLSGQASSSIPPECDLNITAHDFGLVGVGWQESEYVVITNTGGGVLPVDLSLEQEGTAFRMNQDPGLYELGPGQELQVQVDFHPEAFGDFSAVLSTGTICVDITFTGEGREPVESYYVPQQLVMGSTPSGHTNQLALVISNNGETTITGDLQLTGDPEFILINPGEFSVEPFTQVHRFVNFTPQANGPFAATITTGLPGNEEVAVSGYGVPIMPGSNNTLELYFNAAWTNNTAWTTETDEVIYAYLVLHNPSATGGVAGWELCLDMVGDSVITSWDIEGSSNGNIPGDCPTVMLDSPLPPTSDLLLATLEILVPTPYQTLIYLRPGDNTPLPDYAAYVDGGDGVTRIPMDTEHDYYIAAIDLHYVDVQIPDSPQVVALSEGVRLQWSCAGEAEGYHVYRRVGEEAPRRLTDSPLVCSGGQAVFTDNPQAPGGTHLFYSTSAMVGGNETPHSTEVEYVMAGVMPAAAKLLPNYPNPFNPETRIPFALDRAGHIKLTVFDLSGRLVKVLADEYLAAGDFEQVWNGRDQAGRSVPSGAYYFRLETVVGVFMQKAMLLK